MSGNLTVPPKPPSPEQICPCGECTTTLEAALCFYRFGLQVIPVGPKSKVTAVTWDWHDDLSVEKIKKYFTLHPDHELGAIVGDNYIVFDPDTPESIFALNQIEKAFDLTPYLVVKTKKGEHHYYKRAAGTYVKSDGHSSEKYPERIDIKTGRALVILPPSINKSIERCEVESADELSITEQDSIDAVFRHNGRPEPRPPSPSPKPRQISVPTDHEKIRQLVNLIDPDSGYEDWFSVFVAVHTETQGSDDGFDIVDDWSSHGSKYPGTEKLRYIWDHLHEVENPRTIGTIIHIARLQGANVDSVIKLFEEFEPCETQVIDPAEKHELEKSAAASTTGDSDSVDSLAQFSLRGQSAKLKKMAMEAVLVLSKIAVMGELTAIYARAGVGKTLIVLKLLIEAIKDKLIDPNQVYLINADDSSKGLIQKLELAEKYGFHMITPGLAGFEVSEFLIKIKKMVSSGIAKGCVVILDTGKKFTDLMNKIQNSAFNTVLREFSFAGGTVIVLAHTNKKRDAEGKPIPAGTSDMRDDFDCTYIADVVSHDEETGEKVVKLTADKIRIGGADELVFSYIRTQDTDYFELFESVKLLSRDDLKGIEHTAKMREDETDIEILKQLIRDGVIGKMELATEAVKLSVTSKKELLRIIERYTGSDPARNHWDFNRKDRGRMEFYLLNSDA